MASLLHYGGSLCYGGARLRYGGIESVVADSVIVHTLIHAHYPGDHSDSPTIATWTGIGVLEFGNPAIHYTGFGHGVIGVETQTNALDTAGNIRVSLIGLTQGFPDGLLAPPPEIFATIQRVFSIDGGATWKLLPNSFIGRVSGPEVRREVLSFDVVTDFQDDTRNNPQVWSDTAQRLKYPQDLGFQHIIDFAEGIEFDWPPFDETVRPFES